MEKMFFRSEFSENALKAQVTIGILEYAGLAEEEAKYLSENEKKAFGKFKTAKRRDQFIAGRYIAKECVRNSYPFIASNLINIVNGVWGFPLINSEHLQKTTVSIAHTDHFAAALFFAENTHPLGIDIEEIRDHQIPSLQNFISSQEQELISSTKIPYPKALHMIWSAKEAAGKALKVGFHIPEDCYKVSSLEIKGDICHVTFGNLPILKAVGWFWKNISICIAFPSVWVLDKIETGI